MADVLSPRHMKRDKFYYVDKELDRLKIILRGKGCSMPTCTMCPLPKHGIDSNLDLNTSYYGEQFDFAIDSLRIGTVEAVALYNDGSYYSEREMPCIVTDFLEMRVRALGARYMFIESLPRFITESRIARTMDNLQETKLNVAIGLQSANKDVRSFLLNSPFSEREFEHAIKTLKGHGCDVRIHVLLKPPMLTELEAILDAQASIRFAFDMGADLVSVCPLRIGTGTLVEGLHRRGMYQQIGLHSIVETVTSSPNLSRTRIDGIEDDTCAPEDRLEGGCGQCSSELKLFFRSVNHGERNPINHFDQCNCYRQRIQSEIEMFQTFGFLTLDIPERMQLALDVLSGPR